MPFLPPNQQRQSTEGTDDYNSSIDSNATIDTLKAQHSYARNFLQESVDAMY